MCSDGAVTPLTPTPMLAVLPQQWDYRIRDHLMNVFMTDEKTASKLKGEDPSKNPRAMAKLFKNVNSVHLSSLSILKLYFFV